MYILRSINYTILIFIFIARNITEECEKGIFLNACIMELTREQTKNGEEHEKEETKGEEEGGEEEPVQKLISVLCPPMSTSVNMCHFRICNMG